MVNTVTFSGTLNRSLVITDVHGELAGNKLLFIVVSLKCTRVFNNYHAVGGLWVPIMSDKFFSCLHCRLENTRHVCILNLLIVYYNILLYYGL